MTVTVLNNAALNDTGTHTLQRGAVMAWLTAGAATISHDAGVIHTLVIGERTRLELGPGQTLTFTATAGSTTAKVAPI